MGRKRGRRLRTLAKELAHTHPELEELEDVEALIRRGLVRVDGLVVRNAASLVRAGASIAVGESTPLRGEAKLRPALTAFGVRVSGRVALDVGAAAGGFTRVLLEAGAARVYAVDAGHGQLLGSLQQDPRVVSLERTNLAELGPALVPEVVEVITLDLSYLAIARAAPQLERLRIAADADLVALVKPMFELSLAAPPTDPVALAEAERRASRGLEASGWQVAGSLPSPVRGARGAIELLLHARRASHRR
jgi:23S rRNA (cytidine1920-2'-O)/16S rRNA (cytidine1409-2'-O)-methyltransferase